MSDNSGAGDKTEQATPKRMKELRRDGSLQRSQDLSAWIVVAAAVLVLPLVFSSGREEASRQLAAIAIRSSEG